MTEVSSAPSPERQSLWSRFVAVVAGIEDGKLLRVVFFVLLAGSAGMLWLDYNEMQVLAPDQPVSPVPSVPVLPAVERPELSPDDPAFSPQFHIESDRSVLTQPMTVSLQQGGVLRLEGMIDREAAERLKAELEARGEYVSVISLNSPGGEVAVALDMGRMIREGGFDTEVDEGMFCASSCPLLLASGVQRIVGATAAVGVHQVYVTQHPGVSSAQVLSDAQVRTAEITRYLSDMGVDPALWLHALETPPDKLYYLTGDEMAELRLAETPAG